MRDFDWVKGYVPGASDLDLVCERNGHVLFIEGKRWENGVTVPWGQHKMLLALSVATTQTVVLVGQHEDGSALSYMTYNSTKEPVFTRTRTGQAAAYFGPEKFQLGTRETLGELVKAWFDSRKKTAA